VPGTVNSNLLFTDATYDIGASGATRPRDLFLSRNLTVGGTLTLAGGVNLNGNVTVGDSSADTLTINSTITSNLIFTDNTYDIGASGATRPRSLFLAGNITAAGNQTLTGALTVDSTTDSTSTTTGSIQTDGGLGVAKALFVGTTASIAGVATFSAGSAAAPAITATGDTNTGIWFPAADTIAFTEGGVESMRIDASGILGLAVTPSAWAGITGSALEIASNGAAFLLGTGGQLFLGNNAFYGASGWVYKRTAGASYAYQANGQHEWQIAASGTAGNPITFTQAMTLDAGGRLFLGTTSQILSGFANVLSNGSSTQQLVIADTVAYNANPTASINFSTKVTSAGDFGNNGYIRGAKENATDANFASYLSFATTTSGNSTLERIRITSGGDVGIGTTSPATKLNIENAGACQLQMAYSSTIFGRVGRLSSGNYEFSSYENGGNLLFGTTTVNGSTTERARIDSSGNLGLGVTPSAWVSSYRAFSLGYSSNGMFSGGNTQLGLTQNAYLDSGVSWRYTTSNPASQYIQTSSVHSWRIAASGTAGNVVSFTDAMTLTAAGNLGIGNTSPATTLAVGSGAGSGGYNGGVYLNRGASTYNFYEASDGTNSIIFGLDNTLSNAKIGTINSYPVGFYTSNTERVQINSAGTLILKNDYQEQTFTANSSTAITLNIVTNGTDQVITLTGTATITMPTATAGKSFLLKLKTGAGAYTVTWTTVKWPGGTAPTLTSTASRMDIFSFFSDGTNWYGCTVGQNYTP